VPCTEALDGQLLKSRIPAHREHQHPPPTINALTDDLSFRMLQVLITEKVNAQFIINTLSTINTTAPDAKEDYSKVRMQESAVLQCLLCPIHTQIFITLQHIEIIKPALSFRSFCTYIPVNSRKKRMSLDFFNSI